MRCYVVFFFFSSRRRHTRSLCDWSSDVCSSDLTGEAIRALSMEERMTVCNMSIEAGARAGMIAPDETTVAYLAGRPRAPSGAAWDRAVAKWRELRTDRGATYDKIGRAHV